MNIDKIKKNLTNALGSMDLPYTETHSRVSESVYIYVQVGEDDLKKIRIANHANYASGEVDFEVRGDSADARNPFAGQWLADLSQWWEVVEELAAITDKPLPASVKRLRTLAENKRQAEALARAEAVKALAEKQALEADLLPQAEAIAAALPEVQKIRQRLAEGRGRKEREHVAARQAFALAAPALSGKVKITGSGIVALV